MCKLNCAQGIQIQNVLLYISTQENSHKTVLQIKPMSLLLPI